MIDFEVRYIIPMWKNNTIYKLDVSQELLEVLETNNNSKYLINSITYPEAEQGFAVLGFHILGKTLHTPCFISANGEKIELEQVVDPRTGKKWWTEKHINSTGNFHTGTLFNKAGKIDLIIQEKHVSIENNTFSFTTKELEAYLADFRNGLWKLILENNSLAKGNVSTNKSLILGGNLDIFKQFALSVEGIAQKPAIRLEEILEKRPIRQIKPLPRTFREYSINPNAQNYSSRAHRESFDTPENRFVHHTINRVLLLLKTTLHISEQQELLFGNYIEREEARKHELQKNEKVINSKVFDDEIERIEREIKAIRSETSAINAYLDKFSSSKDIASKKCIVVIGEPYGSSMNQFFLSEVDGVKFPKSSYRVIEFPPDLKKSLLFIKNNLFEIDAIFEEVERTNRSNKKYIAIHIRFLYSIKIKNLQQIKEFNRLKSKKLELKKTNWIAPWTREENEENKKELDNIEKSKIRYSNYKEEYSYLISFINPIMSRLKKIKQFFKANKVRTQAACPSSMIFIQNPAYASVKLSYAEIAQINGLDESVFNAIEKIEEIGLVDIPHLYERWCLIQIIDVLNSIYEFKLQNNWQENFLAAIMRNSKNIELFFEQDERGVNVKLSYEMVLRNGKRPDFILEISKNKQVYKLVLDSKFKKFDEASLTQNLNMLYYDKNYSENFRNQVFILHPNFNIIENETSPLAWGKSCDYGQTNNHSMGSIYLAPSLRNNSIENLQRLIGMFLQQTLVIEEAYKNQHSKCLATCIKCGNHSEKLKIFQNTTKSGSKAYTYTVQCYKCGQYTKKTHCYNGDYNILYKNGLRWTYHRTRAEEIYNVVCPNCASFF